MKCVKSVKFSVKVNGELLRTLCRHICFLLCGEGLSSLLKAYRPNFIDKGIRVSNKAPWISHLLLADGSLIFIGAKKENARRLNDILRIYNECSGQKENRGKSCLFQS